MEINRRHFFKISGTLAAASVVKTGKTAQAANAPSVSEDAYGCLVAMLTNLKGLPIGYNRDLQEDKRILFEMPFLAFYKILAPK